MRAKPATDVNHAFQSMPLAVHGRFAARYKEGRLLPARVVRATAAYDVHHAFPRMKFAVCRYLGALDIESRPSRAGVM